MTVDIQVLLAIITQFTVIVAAIVAGLAWLKKWLRQQVSEPLERVHNEVNPDHGRSLKDTTERIEVKVDNLTGRFDDHLVLDHGPR